MVRRNRRRHNRKDQWVGLALIFAGSMLFIFLGGVFYWVKSTRIDYDETTYCPKEGPRELHVILLDRSDPITPQQAQQIRQVLAGYRDNAPEGTRFDIYTIESDSKNEQQPLLSICAPIRPENANIWIQNSTTIRNRYDEGFSATLDKAVDQLLTISKRPTSPIIESLRAAAITSFGPIATRSIPLHLTVISDMVQHSAYVSHFRSAPNFEQLSRDPSWPMLRPELRGADTNIFYLLRPEAVRGSKNVQNRGHQVFWEHLVTQSNGRIESIKPL